MFTSGNSTISNPTAIAPANKGISGLVRDKVKVYAASQNERLEQALASNGTELAIWNRVQSKDYCTCQGRLELNNDSSTDSYRNSAGEDDFDGTQRDYDLGGFSLEEVKPTSNSGREELRSSTTTEEPDEDLMIGESSDIDDILTDSFSPESIEDRSLVSQEVDLLHEGGERTICGICFGTGWISGYSLYGGQRIVLDASEFSDFSTQGVTVERTYPASFVMSRNNSNNVTFTKEIPSYYTPVKIALYNNTKDITTDGSFDLEFKPTTISNFTSLNTTSLTERIGERNTLNIKVTPSTLLGDAEEVIKFTHLEIILKFNIFPFGDMPDLNIPENFEYEDIVLTTNMNLSSKASNITNGCVINDMRYGLTWKVNNTNKKRTDEGQIINTEVDCRLVQRFEQLYNLTVFRRNTFERQYQGLVPSQGFNSFGS